MRILTIGDIVGRPGREYVYAKLNGIREQYKIDFCIANGENAAGINGINGEITNTLIERGVDVITLGNHAFGVSSIANTLDENKRIIRPANYPPETPGFGYTVMDTGLARIAVINAMGRMHVEPVLDCPFRAVDKILRDIEGKWDVCVIDLHAETTSEKIAFANYFDGRVTFVFGTHTHVQTADERILPKGTGYITDLGMTGVVDSVLGVNKETIIEMFLSRRKVKFEAAEGEVMLSGAVVEVDNRTFKVTGIERVNV